MTTLSPDPAGLDAGGLLRLRRHLDLHAPDLLPGELSSALLAGGRSNLTYAVHADGRAVVLRRPPLGSRLGTAHDMSREYRVLGALTGTGVPVPEPYLHCDDEDVIGAPFYLMERVDGVVFRRGGEESSRLDPVRAHALSLALVDALADLHALDVRAAGLADFGRPAGFLDRQLVRWAEQAAASRTRDVPGLAELQDLLRETVPASPPATLVHGDYGLGNVVCHPARPEVAAILDWEMATLGDPLCDLGMLLVKWDSPEEMDGVAPRFGFASAAELVDRYAARTGADLATLSWYVAFASYKLAVIREGIYRRYTRGQTVGDGFAEIGDRVAPLVARGLARLSRTP